MATKERNTTPIPAQAGRQIRVGIYGRISTLNHGQDVTLQLREAREYCERRGFDVVGYHLHFNIGHTKCWLPFPQLEPVLSWKTRVISLRDVTAHEGVGYDGAYVTASPARLAALPVGYADGLSRRLSSRGRVIIRGCYAPIVGNIAMDITMVDVTLVEGIRVGDEVILLGASGDCRVEAWEHARLEETIPYEVLCAIGHRVPRKYVGQARNTLWYETEVPFTCT